MSLLRKLLSWILKGLYLFASVAPALWGVTIYSGLAFSVYVMIDQTASLVSSFSLVFSAWADTLNADIASFFNSANEHSFFQFFCYVCSLDVPIEWFRSSSTAFLRYFLTYACGAIIGVIELCAVVLGVYWVRKRLKTMSAGFGPDTSGGI